MAPTDDFETVRRRAIGAIERDDVVSVYAGLIHEDRQDAYYFANDVDDDPGAWPSDSWACSPECSPNSPTSLPRRSLSSRERADEMTLQP